MKSLSSILYALLHFFLLLHSIMIITNMMMIIIIVSNNVPTTAPMITATLSESSLFVGTIDTTVPMYNNHYNNNVLGIINSACTQGQDNYHQYAHIVT